MPVRRVFPCIFPAICKIGLIVGYCFNLCSHSLASVPHPQVGIGARQYYRKSWFSSPLDFGGQIDPNYQGYISEASSVSPKMLTVLGREGDGLKKLMSSLWWLEDSLWELGGLTSEKGLVLGHSHAPLNSLGRLGFPCLNRWHFFFRVTKRFEDCSDRPELGHLQIKDCIVWGCSGCPSKFQG